MDGFDFPARLKEVNNMLEAPDVCIDGRGRGISATKTHFPKNVKPEECQ